MNLANRPRFAKLKPSRLVFTINNLLADLLFRQAFFRQMLKMSQFAKLSPHHTFPLYGIQLNFIATLWEKILIGIMIAICSRFSKIVEVCIQVCECRVISSAVSDTELLCVIANVQ